MGIAGHHRLHRRRAAAVGDVLELDAGSLAQQFDHQVGLRGRAGGGVVELVGIGLGAGDELGQRLGLHLGIDQEHHRVLRHHDHRCEIALGVIGQLHLGGRHDRVARCHHQQRMPVGRRLGDRVGPDDAARRRSIVDNHRLAEGALQMWTKQARHHIVQATRRKRHDQANEAGGIGFGLREARTGGEDPRNEQGRGPIPDSGSDAIESWHLLHFSIREGSLQFRAERRR